MSEATAGGGVQPVPRDLPDQQAGPGYAPERDVMATAQAGGGPAASSSSDDEPGPPHEAAAAAREEPGGREDPERPAAPAKPVPRDLQDQQASEDDDRWDAAPDPEATGSDDRPGGTDEEVPETDEAGTGRKGAPLGGSPNPEHPVPDEPAG